MDIILYQPFESFVQIQPFVRRNYKSQYDITLQMGNHGYNYWFPSPINSSINFTGILQKYLYVLYIYSWF